MKAICEKLKSDITVAARRSNIDPYKDPFKASDLGLNASDYGSFSDHCKKGTTKSSKWCGCGLLKLVQKKPFRYILMK